MSAEPVIADAPPAALLRGTARGLEVVVDGGASIADITAAVMKRLDEAPGFFKGSDVRIRVEDGPLAAGCLSQLDDIALRFDLRIVEVTAARRGKPALVPSDADAVPVPNLAAGSAPSPTVDEVQAAAAPSFEEEAPTGSNLRVVPLPPPTDLAEPVLLADADLEVVSLPEETPAPGECFEEPTQTKAPVRLAASPEIPLRSEPGTRVVIGPVRSGVILEHFGHLIIFGDINPGAEVRASGNIVVLGRLRGTAHAGIGQEVGFILALRLEPQQLRIGRQVARAADSDTPASEPELAYLSGDGIIVETYRGRLPQNLATSI